MSIRLILVLAAAFSAVAGCGDAAVPSAPSPALSGVDVSFMVDPRIARGVYLGDRWISPPYLRVGEGEQVTVEARAYLLDAAGRPTTIAPAWRVSDPGMVTISPDTGNEVQITVRRAGESRLDITGPAIAKGLIIRAAYPYGVIQVEILQEE